MDIKLGDRVKVHSCEDNIMVLTGVVDKIGPDWQGRTQYDVKLDPTSAAYQNSTHYYGATLPYLERVG